MKTNSKAAFPYILWVLFFTVIPFILVIYYAATSKDSGAITLENLAKNISYKVKRTKRPVALEAMNPFERRVIHSALQNDKFVTTHSEGEEPYRRVVVTLKK